MEGDFSLLGLNKYEINTYESLVKLGKSTATKISKNSGVPYGKIYETLSSLERKGLVVTLTGNVKNFVPSDPKKIIELIESKAKCLEDIRTRVSELKNVYSSSIEETVEVAEGIDGFARMIEKMPVPVKTEYNLRFFSSGKSRVNYLAQNLEKLRNKIDVKTLADRNRCTPEILDGWGKVLPEMRHLENKGVVISIVDDAILISLIRSNITFLIKDKAFIEIMKVFFINTYNKSTKIF